MDSALPLSIEQRRALKNRTVLDPFGNLEVNLARVSDLSPDIEVTKGEVGLVVDPVEASGDWALIYLINVSDRPLKGALYNGLSARREVFNGWYWEGCVPLSFRCLTFETERDLTPGSVAVLKGPGFLKGDEIGQIRYTVCLPDGEILASKPQKGRYPSALLKDCRLRQGNGSFVAYDVCFGVLENKWSDCRVITELAEVEAALELERHYDTSFSARGRVIEWLERIRTARGHGPVANPVVVSGISRVMDADWDHHLDYRGRLQRCLAALRHRPALNGPAPPGSPESHRALVLRYLSHSGFSAAQNPEEKEHLEKAQRSGNSWDATADELEEIRREAELSLRSGTEAEKQAATELLGMKCFEAR